MIIKKIFALFLVILISLIVFLIAGEWYLRYFTHYGVSHIVDFVGGIVPNNSEILWQQPELMSELEPYFWEQPELMSELEPYFKKSLQKQGKYRILVIGDSIAIGGELKEGELAFPKMLENILNKNYRNHKFEVLTYGSGGYSTFQEVRFYETKGKLLEPNLLILAYCFNDTAEISPGLTRKDGRYIISFYKGNVPYLNKLPFNRYFTEKFLLFRLINEALINFSKKYNFPVSVDYCLSPLRRIYGCFERLYNATKASQSFVAVVLFPRLANGLPHSDRLMHRAIKKWCKEFGFLDIDLSEKYKEYNHLRLRVTFDDGCHPNEFGHKIAAEFIAEKLKQNSCLPTK